MDVVDDGQLWAESFADFAFLPSTTPTPVVLSHEDHKVVGHVVACAAHNGWHIADFTLDHSRPLSAVALDLIRIGTPISIGARTLRHDKILARDGIKRHTIARHDEISILRPNETPAYRGAQITGIYELPPVRRRQPPSGHTELQPGDEVFYGGPRIRRYFETKITVR